MLNRIFTWWNGCTVGTLWHTRRHGEKVGEDAFGNAYYQSDRGARRWVIFAKEAEASSVPPDWHGWLHHTWDETPERAGLHERPWLKPHAPNLTGTPAAYAPPGSITTPESRPRAGGDYEPWRPEAADG